MGEVFTDLTKRVGIFMIAGQAILHFGVGKQYEKYVKLIISLMVAAQLISGFTAFFQNNVEDMNILERFQADHYTEWETHMEEFEKRLVDRQILMEQNLGMQQIQSEQEYNNQLNQNRIVIEKIKIGE